MSKHSLQAISVALVFAVGLTLDQWSKFWVKTHMALHEVIEVTPWFELSFVENNGMAFGMEFFDKYFLTAFRLVAAVAVLWYIVRLLRRDVSWGYLLCLSLILTGAVGNIIDCVFYGLIFDSPAPPYVAQLVPFGQGYGTVLRGRVVDMLHFPLADWTWPEWMPFIGGRMEHFFSYIFNVADACITTGALSLAVFYRHTLARELGEDEHKQCEDEGEEELSMHNE